MERLNFHMYMELGKELQVALAGPAGCAAALPPDAVHAEFPPAPAWRFAIGSVAAALRLARRIRPDVVLCGSGTTAPAGWIVSRLRRIPYAIYLHGLDLIATHPVYRTVFLPAIRRCDLALVNSHHTARLAREAGVPAERIHVIHPGVDLPEHLPDREAVESYRQRLGIGNRPVLLSVGRLTRRKGLAEFVGRCLPEIVTAHPDVLLLIAGGEADKALRRDGGQTERIQQAAAGLKLQNNVRFLGCVPDPELALLFAAASLHVFPVLNVPGDVEGFGMVAIEAAAHGLPTAAFASGGVPDAVSDGESGNLVAVGDYSAFSNKIIKALDLTERSAESCRRFAQSFVWGLFGVKIRTSVGSLINNGRNADLHQENDT